MSDFSRIKFYYDKGWASLDHLNKYVFFGVITPDEYFIITGKGYSNVDN